MRTLILAYRCLLGALLIAPGCLKTGIATAQQGPLQVKNPAFLDGPRVHLRSSILSVEFLKYSATVSSLRPLAEPSLDYTPSDMLARRSADTFYHLGDLDLRVRRGVAPEWVPMSTAFRRKPVKILSRSSKEFRVDVTSSLPQGAGLQLIRTWRLDRDELQLVFTITNTGSDPIELGGVGIPMVFNNILAGRTLEQAYKKCSFYDPYIGEDAGYVQVVPLKGTGPVLLVTPLGRSPLEAWKPILDETDKATGLGKVENDPTRRDVTFEGSFDWMIHTAAFAEAEWKGVNEWNPPTSLKIEPKQRAQFGLRFSIAPDVRSIEETLVAHNRPVAVGIPGYVLPEGIEGRLFLKYASPVESVDIEPSNSLSIHDDGIMTSGLHAYTLHGQIWGTSRLKVTYVDGTVQTVSYRTTKPERQVVSDLGQFISSKQWFDDKTDPFGRAPSFISYDNDAHSQVLQERRVWIAGLSDEGGAGAYLAEAMKELLEPRRDEIAKLEQFIDKVLWGHLQIAQGEHQFGVRKSLFFYQPDAVSHFRYDPEVNPENGSWNKHEAFRIDRTYNYPHVVATYWALYRIARNTEGLVTGHSWDWYLEQAFQTSMAMKADADLFSRFGLMEGTVFTYLLDDLRREGWNEKADAFESYMRTRANRWRAEDYPFGSEMPWDSTGQEEVYAWSKYFGYEDKARVTLNAILGYDPAIPNWGYNGSARRYWDFETAGKWAEIERQLHHYGSGLNAIPLLTEFRHHPDDLYLLRVGYGGVMGPLANIDERGFGSAAFHSFPNRMAFDPYTGDYGSNFFGHAVNTGVYVVHSATFGWLCFGGNLREVNQRITVDVLDSARKRVFIAPLKLWINLHAGEIESLEFDTSTNVVRLHLAPATGNEDKVSLEAVDSTGDASARWHVEDVIPNRSNTYEFPLTADRTVVTIRQ